MTRLTNLEDLLFPVEEHPVFVSMTGNGSEKRLPVPDKKAIVNTASGRVLGVVGRGYRLVSNREALKLAHECCRSVFPETQPGEWKVSTLDAPSTASYVHIDLVHNTATLDFSALDATERPDVYGPFIRVTNSYNGLRSLAFDIGFYRKVCKNGLILPDTIIRFKFPHLRRDIGETVEFNIDQNRLAKLKIGFADALAGLRECAVRRAQFEPLICSVLSLRPRQSLETDIPEPEDWRELVGHLGGMSDRYAGELGENAYAAFNAITEFASQPLENRSVHRDRHSLQRLAGSWLPTFSAECRKPGFSLDGYLAELARPKPPSGAETTAFPLGSGDNHHRLLQPAS